MTKEATVTKSKHTGKVTHNLTHTHSQNRKAVDSHGNHSTLCSDEEKSINTIFLHFFFEQLLKLFSFSVTFVHFCCLLHQVTNMFNSFCSHDTLSLLICTPTPKYCSNIWTWSRFSKRMHFFEARFRSCSMPCSFFWCASRCASTRNGDTLQLLKMWWTLQCLMCLQSALEPGLQMPCCIAQ